VSSHGGWPQRFACCSQRKGHARRGALIVRALRVIQSWAALLLLATLFTAGCKVAGPVEAGGIRVLAAETFLGDIARNVAGQRLTVATLLVAGVDPHEFQPAPQDAIKIAQSQVLIVNGLGYESWLTKTLQPGAVQPLRVIASDGLKPSPDPSREHTDGDPHMWMNPLNVIQYAANIRDGLTKADPAGAAAYAANADRYAGRLRPWTNGSRAKWHNSRPRNACWSRTMTPSAILRRPTASK